MGLRQPLIVGVGGTLRDSSTSERALRLALGLAAGMGCATEVFAGEALNLAPYDPAAGERDPRAVALVEALRRADGVIIASPGYHGTISGLLKNALDYTEDLRGDRRVYLSDRAIGVIVCADGIQAMGSTLNTIRSMAHALRAWPTPFAAVVNSGAKPFAADGRCLSTEVEQSLRLVAAQVVEFAQMRLAADEAATETPRQAEARPSTAEISERMAAMEMTFRLMG